MSKPEAARCAICGDEDGDMHNVPPKKLTHRFTTDNVRVIMWKALYCNEQSADAVDAAITKLREEHPEWELDFDNTWDCEVVNVEA